MNLRPEVFHSVKLGDETQVCLPSFAFVVLEKPQRPSRQTEQMAVTLFLKQRYLMAAATSQPIDLIVYIFNY